MGVIEIIGGIVICVLAVMIIAVVLMQEHKAKMGSLAGGSDEGFGRNMGKTTEAMLSRATKVLTIVFFAAVILLGVAEKFMA
ncbi:MAG: preprotein translocase subunit SecG [Oscillospiraceae bacterium]|nr:preprotein translocase subunit SecG [Oscillospiraceae bacterium]